VDEGAKWQLVAVISVVVLAAFGVVRLLDRGGGGGGEVRVTGASSGGGAAGGRSGRREAGPGLVVHVTGAVRRPGVYRVPQGARVAAAMRSAGGAARQADLTAVNLAALLQDGQQVVVPSRVAGAVAAGSAGGAGEAPINLATATADQLEELDGIGETIAERIVEYRSERGGLSSVDQLAEVDGIGEIRLEALKDELGP
jgi:competence protein ComEA